MSEMQSVTRCLPWILLDWAEPLETYLPVPGQLGNAIGLPMGDLDSLGLVH